MKFEKKTNNPVELANIECGIECGTRPIVGLSNTRFSILVAILYTM